MRVKRAPVSSLNGLSIVFLLFLRDRVQVVVLVGILECGVWGADTDCAQAVTSASPPAGSLAGSPLAGSPLALHVAWIPGEVGAAEPMPNFTTS